MIRLDEFLAEPVCCVCHNSNCFRAECATREYEKKHLKFVFIFLKCISDVIYHWMSSWSQCTPLHSFCLRSIRPSLSISRAFLSALPRAREANGCSCVAGIRNAIINCVPRQDERGRAANEKQVANAFFLSFHLFIYSLFQLFNCTTD